jgi:lipid II:glycine glycyltransferase (peptidoglycan interpeptide bridge formation enzyme)
LARDLNCISLTIITNPFLSDAEFYSQPVHPDYIFNNFCQIIDLHNLFPENDSYYSEKSGYTIDRNVRRNLKKASENNVTVEWATEADFEEWYSIHVKRHTELGAEPLPRTLLTNILDILSQFNMAGLVVAKLNNRIAGGCIFVWNKEVADAYILSSDSDYTEYGINHAITDFAVRYFHEKGFRWFNWQGCKRDSGVYRFKQSWGGMEKSYQFLTWTFDGFQNIFSYNFEDIPREYKWHYVAPFEAIKNRAQKGVFNK